MKKSIACGLSFLVGGAAGCGITYYILNKKYKEAMDEEVKSVKDSFNKMAKDLADKNKNMKDEIVLSRPVKVEQVPLEDSKEEVIVRNIFDTYGGDASEVRYDKIKPSKEAVEELEEDEEEEEMIGKVELHKPMPAKGPNGSIGRAKPYFIKEDDYGSEDDYNLVSLYLHTEDGTVCDDNDEPISDPSSTLGQDNIDAMCKGNVPDGNVYIRNDNRLCDYEIVIVEDSYES